MAVTQQRKSSTRARARQTPRGPLPGGKTIFFAAKDKTLADIISIRSPTEAKKSVKQLREWADDDVNRVRKAIRSATLAANRAEVSLKRRKRPLSSRERQEMRQVALMYRTAAHAFSAKLDTLKGGRRPRTRQRRAA